MEQLATTNPIVLITGATDRLGHALAHRLASDGAGLILHGRDRDRLDRIAEEIAAKHSVDRPRTLLADLAELAQVRRLAAEVRDATDRLRRLGVALHLQPFAALGASPGAPAHYDTLRERNIGHHAALRQLANRLVGILHGCLKTATLYDEDTAWVHHRTDTDNVAA